MEYIFLLCISKTQQGCHTLKLLIIIVLPFSAFLTVVRLSVFLSSHLINYTLFLCSKLMLIVCIVSFVCCLLPYI